MNFGELQTDLFARGFSYLNDNGTGLLSAQRWINQSYQEICDQEKWPFLEAFTSGVAPLTISDLGEVMDVVNSTTQTSLVEGDHASLVYLYPDLTLSGASSYYYITGGTVINTYPTSTSATIGVRYYKNPTDLSAASDTPIIPTPFHDLITLGAWRRALLDDSSSGDYATIVQEWQSRLEMMRRSQMVDPTYQLVTFSSEDW